MEPVRTAEGLDVELMVGRDSSVNPCLGFEPWGMGDRDRGPSAVSAAFYFLLPHWGVCVRNRVMRAKTFLD